MATDLYETLRVSRDATAQEIRQAYRRLALDTHPDKLPRDATPEEKRLAEERFTKVNNAYEVLSDDTRRQIYDRHGRWPAEERQNSYPGPSGHHHHHRSTPHRHHTSPFGRSRDPFDDPFFTQPAFGFGSGFGGFGLHGGHHRASGSRSPFGMDNSFAFTDAREFFKSIFEDDPFFSGVSPFAGYFGHQPRSSFSGQPFGGPMSMFPQMGSMFPAITDPQGMQSSSFRSQSVFSHSGGNGQWASESRSSKTINGVTETEWRRVDRNGNVHVTRTFADGRERYLLNGVEQPTPVPAPVSNTGRAIEQAPPPPPYPSPLPNHSHSRHGSDVSRRSERRHRSDTPYDSAPIREERDRHHGDRKHRHDSGRDEQEHHFIDVDAIPEDRQKRHWWQRH